MIIYKKIIFYFFILCLFLSIISCKGGKGGGGRGGGFGSFGGSRIGSSNNRLGSNVNNARTGYGSGFGGSGGYGGGGSGGYIGNQYRGGAGAAGNGLGGSMYSSGRSSGMRWASFGAGLLAYNAMSNLARSGSYHSYYHRNGYHSSNSKYMGEWCVNNEDFNGTVFGRFQCPLPEFDTSAKYCCGTNQTQYCCNYFDDDSRRVSVLAAVISIAAIIICSGFCISRLLKKRGSLFKSDQRPCSSIPAQFQNANNNMRAGPQPYFNPMQNRSAQNFRPSGPPNPRDSASAPFITNQNNTSYQGAPYPLQSTMPQPANVYMPRPATVYMPQPNIQSDVPPSYNEAVSENSDKKNDLNEIKT